MKKLSFLLQATSSCFQSHRLEKMLPVAVVTITLALTINDLQPKTQNKGQDAPVNVTVVKDTQVNTSGTD
jgi:hypothetical protein